MQTEDQVVENNQEEVTEISQAEQLARSQGWRPKEEWEGNEDKWVDYKEFNFRGELMDRIKRQNSEVSELRQVVQDLVRHNQEISKKDHKRVMDGLKVEKIKAIEEGNAEKAVEIDDMIDDMKNKVNQPSQNPTSIPPDVQRRIQDDFSQWKAENTWYGSDSEITREADELGMDKAIRKERQLRRPLGPDDLKEIYDEVTKSMRKLYPEKFHNQNRAKPAAVASSTVGTSKEGGKKKYTINDLPEEARSIARRFEKQGVMSVHDYAMQLKESGAI